MIPIAELDASSDAETKTKGADGDNISEREFEEDDIERSPEPVELAKITTGKNGK